MAVGMNAVEYAAALIEHCEGDYQAARQVLNNSKAYYPRMTQDFADDTLFHIDMTEELAWLD